MTNNETLQNSLAMLEKRNSMMIERAKADGVITPAEEKFLALSKDEVFTKGLSNCATIEEVKAFLEGNGVDFSTEYIQEMLMTAGNLIKLLEANDGELSEEELEQIAGGWSWSSFWKGAGVCGIVAGVVGLMGGPLVALAAAAAGAVIGGVVGGATEGF